MSTPHYVKFQDMLDHMPKGADRLTVPLGMSAGGERQYATLPELGNMLITGVSGTGKSNLIRVMLETLLRRREDQDDLRVILAGLDAPSEFERFYDYAGFTHIIDSEELLVVLTQLAKELDERVVRPYQYQPEPVILMVIDDYASLDYPERAFENYDLVEKLREDSNRHGIYLIVCTQSFKKSLRLLHLMQTVVAFRAPDYDMLPQTVGRCQVRRNGEWGSEIQNPFFTGHEEIHDA